MSRWLLLLLALLLPLQLAWARVHAPCSALHDAGEPTALHAPCGHGDHGDATPAKPDCGHCHGHFNALPPSLVVLPAASPRIDALPRPVPRLATLPQPRPERPQWRALA